jgi:release factor glutamine methyltransferase
MPERLKPLLDRAVSLLAAAGCETPALDARLLFQHATGLAHEDIILQPGREIADEASREFRHMIERRERREPVSRILGEREFYGRVFKVTPAVLDPRGDTETLIDASLRFMTSSARVLDLGTGSGAIIVTLLAERRQATGLATDTSPAALDVARENAERLGVQSRLRFAEGRWWDPVQGQFDLIVSNPPYIPQASMPNLAPDVRNFDPLTALSGGEDGLECYRDIASGALLHLAGEGHVLVEIGAGQADDVERIFMAAGLQPAGRFRDLGGHERCLAFCSPNMRLVDTP